MMVTFLHIVGDNVGEKKERRDRTQMFQHALAATDMTCNANRSDQTLN